jgi:hypothetical protein
LNNNVFLGRSIKISASLLLLALLSIGCAASAVTTSVPLPTTIPTADNPTSTLQPGLVTPTLELETSTPSVEVTPAYDPREPDSWKSLPVIPETISERVRQIYMAGKESGLNQNAFSKVGDCETYSPYFLYPFDMDPVNYDLGEYHSLEAILTEYRGSFSRASLAAKQGFSVSSVLSPFWSDPNQCKADESPLICEIRVHKPAIVLVMFGTNDVKTSTRDGFEKNLRQVLDWAILNNVVPVLATKADNLELDGSINAIIARLAYDYQIPLWNYWRALQDLPAQGLDTDKYHLTYAQPLFDNAENMQKGWPVRNLTALQMLEKLHQELAD